MIDSLETSVNLAHFNIAPLGLFNQIILDEIAINLEKLYQPEEIPSLDYATLLESIKTQIFIESKILYVSTKVPIFDSIPSVLYQVYPSSTDFYVPIPSPFLIISYSAYAWISSKPEKLGLHFVTQKPWIQEEPSCIVDLINNNNHHCQAFPKRQTSAIAQVLYDNSILILPTKRTIVKMSCDQGQHSTNTIISQSAIVKSSSDCEVMINKLIVKANPTKLNSEIIMLPSLDNFTFIDHILITDTNDVHQINKKVQDLAIPILKQLPYQIQNHKYIIVIILIVIGIIVIMLCIKCCLKLKTHPRFQVFFKNDKNKTSKDDSSSEGGGIM